MFPKLIPQFLLLLSLIFIDSATSQSPIFVDVTEESGIHFKHSSGKTEHKHIIETMGSGVVFFDYDSDSDADLYFVNSGTFHKMNKTERKHNREMSSIATMVMGGSQM